MRRKVDIGQMRHRVIVYDTTRVEDDAGGFDRKDPSDETKIATVWADVTPVSARERTWGGQHVENVTHKVLVRYNPLFQGGQTIVHKWEPMYVISVVDPDQLEEWMYLMVREGGPQ